MSDKELMEIKKQVDKMNKEELKELAMVTLIARKKAAARRMKSYYKKRGEENAKNQS